MTRANEDGSERRDPGGLTVEDRLPDEAIAALFDACAPEVDDAD